MRRVVLLVSLTLLGCSARAGRALLPQVSVRGSARLERSETRARWRHDLRLVATFRTDARLPRPPIPEPPDHAPVSALAGRLPCRIPALCAWEERARHAAFAAFRAEPGED